MLTNKEIQERIAKNDKTIQEELDPVSFILNEKIQALLEDNKRLRLECTHEFKDGYCIYCGMAEK